MKVAQKKTTSSQPQTLEPAIKPAGNEKKEESLSTIVLVLIVAIVVLAGVGTGYVLAVQEQEQGGVTVSETGSKTIKTEKVFGSLDQTFKDEVEGMLEKGGIGGEGTHHLVRDGGPSQYVYLISSVVDLEQFVGKKVKVWGETNAAQYAGWLMDVGKLELLE